VTVFAYNIAAEEVRDVCAKGFGYPIVQLKDAPRVGVAVAESFEEVRSHLLKNGSMIRDLVVVVPQSVHEIRAGSLVWCAWMLVVTGTEPPVVVLRLVSAVRMLRRMPLVVVTPYYDLEKTMVEANVRTFPPVRE
jgi:hypothetical protein